VLGQGENGDFAIMRPDAKLHRACFKVGLLRQKSYQPNETRYDPHVSARLGRADNYIVSVANIPFMGKRYKDSPQRRFGLTQINDVVVSVNQIAFGGGVDCKTLEPINCRPHLELEAQSAVVPPSRAQPQTGAF
jgi:hypothetical protein